MKNLIKIISVIFLALFCTVNFVSADEITGNINTGVNTGIMGTIIVAPTANVPAGTYTSVQNVSLSAVGSINVRYTTDGSTPNCSDSNTYSSPIVVSGTSVLKAIACYGNSITSSVSSFNYVINLPVYAQPIANPLAGTYTSAQSVILTASGSSSIRYTIDGTSPTCSVGTVYSNAISVSSTRTIKTIACYGENYSDVASFIYTINIQPVAPASNGGGGGGGGSSSSNSSTTTTAKTGDINNDTKVDKYDFAMLMSAWNQTGSNSADLNHDGKVDKYDFSLLMLNWNK